MHLSQAYAFLRKRDYVLPEDVATLYQPAVSHRLMLKQEARLNRISTSDILSELLRSVPAPFKSKR
jgi:MoxR-like ATPase